MQCAQPLQLKMMDAPGVKVSDESFKILSNLLQPGSKDNYASAAEAIVALLPNDHPDSTPVWTFGETCIEIAEQIDYTHPAQLKLAGFIEYLSAEKPFGGRFEGNGRYFTMGRLGQSMRDNLSFDEENPRAYINFHAMASNLFERRVVFTDPTWALWEHREAFEEPLAASPVTRHAHILAAAQYILWCGQLVWKEVLCPTKVPKDLRMWEPGKLYYGKPRLDLQRWLFWKEGYKKVASVRMEDDEKDFSKECRDVAARVAALMDAFESSNAFL